MSVITQLTTKAEFDAFIAKAEVTAVHFAASWAPQCEQLNTVLADLLADVSGWTGATIDAENVPEASKACSIKAVPIVILFKAGKEVSRLDGFKPAELRTLLVKATSAVPSSGKVEANEAVPSASLNDRLKALINRAPLMLFMKGTPDTPRCGFSRQVIGLLSEVGAAFSTFDILGDEEVRAGLKEYSNWPTYPQLYHNGELLGGLDVIREEFKDPEFVASLPKAS